MHFILTWFTKYKVDLFAASMLPTDDLQCQEVNQQNVTTQNLWL